MAAPKGIASGLIDFQQGKGSAVIPTSAPSPDVSRIAANVKEKFDKRDAQATKRNEEIDNLLSRGIAIGSDRDNVEMNKRVGDYRTYTRDNMDNILNRSTDQSLQYEKQGRDLDTAASQSKKDREEFDTAMASIETIKDDSIIDKQAYAEAWHKYYWGEDGKKTVWSEDKGVRPKQGDFLNEGRFLSKFTAGDVQPFKGSTSEVVSGKGGRFIASREVEGKFYRVENGQVQVDNDGIPIIEVSDATAEKALQYPQWETYINGQLKLPENADKTDTDLTKEKLEQWAYLQESKKLTKAHATKSATKREMTPDDRNQIEAQIFSGDGAPLIGGTFGKEVITRTEFKNGKHILYSNRPDKDGVVEAELGRIDRQDKEAVTAILNKKTGFGQFTRPELAREKQFTVTDPPVRTWTPKDEETVSSIITNPESKANLDTIRDAPGVVKVTYDKGTPLVGWPSIDIKFEDGSKEQIDLREPAQAKARIKEIYSQAEGIQEAEQQPQGEVPNITSQEAYDALPSGAQYRDSNGTLATKP